MPSVNMLLQVGKTARAACCLPTSTASRILTAWIINGVNLAVGGILASFIRGKGALPDTVSILAFLGTTVALESRMYWLAVRFTDKSAEDAVVAYVRQAQSNLGP